MSKKRSPIVQTGALALTISALLALALAASAQAAPSPPSVSTGSATAVSYSSATVHGTIDPRGSGTSYYFQYGPTHAYGGQTPIASAGAGTGNVSVAAALTGLQPLTVYHYRLVAVSSAGTGFGKDRTFQTTKVPLSLAILTAPNPAPFGAAVTIQGTLSGTENANRQVVLQGNPFPFTAGFQNIGNAELTSADGGFSFTLLNAGITTQYRVATTTKPPVVSPVATEEVAVRVTSHVKRTRRSGWARIYGTVTPAEPGAKVGMLRVAGNHGVLAGGTILEPLNATTSRFSRVVRVHRGIYRVLVQVEGAQVSAYGQPLLIG